MCLFVYLHKSFYCPSQYTNLANISLPDLEANFQKNRKFEKSIDRFRILYQFDATTYEKYT